MSTIFDAAAIATATIDNASASSLPTISNARVNNPSDIKKRKKQKFVKKSKSQTKT